MMNFDAQFAMIDYLKSSPFNWSMSEVATPSAEQVNMARKALSIMVLTGIPAPKLMLLNDGTIGAYWQEHELYASIDFDQDGEWPWTVVNKSVQSGIWTPAEPVPQALHNARVS